MKHEEYNLQCQIIQWARLSVAKYPCLKWLNSSQNGVKLTSAIAGARAKKSGMVKGYPDLFLPYPSKKYYGLFIELKIKPNKPTKEQKEWMEHLNAMRYLAVVCYTYEDAIDVIRCYLN